LGTVAPAENAAKRMKPNRQLPMAYILNLPYVCTSQTKTSSSENAAQQKHKRLKIV